MSGFYDSLCNMLIRPARQTYSDYDLGPPALGSLALRHNFTFQSSQGLQIKASFYKQRNPVHNACVMYLHSFNGSRLQPLAYVLQIIKRGFHFFSMDFAGCGNSEGEYVSLGYHERWDALRAVREMRERWGVREVVVWGRSMGAVTAIKMYNLLLQQQLVGRLNDVRILGLVMDSAFVSLRRMVVQVGQNRINIPQFLIKAMFLMVGSSIEQRANFKMDQLQLLPQLEKVRCPVMLIASKQDTFVSYQHSEQIFTNLPLHEHKHLQYTTGQHYEQRNSQVIQTVLKFIEQKYKIFAQTQILKVRVSHIKNDISGDRPRSLRKYQPKKQPEIAQEERIQRPFSGEKLNALKVTQIAGYQFMTTGSEKRLGIGKINKQYQTEKKIEGPQITFTLGEHLKAKDGLRSKSKPSFSGKIMEVISKMKEQEVRRTGSSERTQDYDQQHHLNIITGKLRKRGKPQDEVQFQPVRIEHHVNPIKFQAKRPNPTSLAFQQQTIEKPKKLSMTAQQYKNSQIKLLKGIVHLSPTMKRKVKARAWEQSRSMSNLNAGSQPYPPVAHLRTSSKLNLMDQMQGCCTPRKE